MKTILHIIDSLGVGGAENLLVNANVHLSGFRHVVVHLKAPNVYQDLLKGTRSYHLSFRGWNNLLSAIFKIRAIIREEQVDLIHSHLYYSTIIARLACPSDVRLISSYHSLLYDPANHSQYSKKLLWLDRLTYRKRYFHIYISQAVKELVSKSIKAYQNYEVLYNFVDDYFFQNETKNYDNKGKKIKIVMVGNLRPEKNYASVIKALAGIKYDFQLDIYGEGRERPNLEALIRHYQLEDRVNLMGQTSDLHKILPKYHLYIAASRFEGFGIALAEAMATGLPCLISDIPAHQEVADQSVLYFDADNTLSLTQKLDEIYDNHHLLLSTAQQSIDRAKQFSKKRYLEHLNNIYQKHLHEH